MKSLLHNDQLSRVVLETDGGRLLVHRLSRDDQILANNKAHRLSQSRLSGKHDLPAHPKGSKISYHFQAPPDLWRRATLQAPDLFAGLRSRDYLIRERSAQRIAQKYPQWVVTAPNLMRID